MKKQTLPRQEADHIIAESGILDDETVYSARPESFGDGCLTVLVQTVGGTVYITLFEKDGKWLAESA